MRRVHLATLLFSCLVILSSCKTKTERSDGTEPKEASFSEILTAKNTFTAQAISKNMLFSVGDIYLDEDRLYVSDLSGDKIVVFDTTGSFLHQWGRTGKGPGELSSPNAISVGPDGRVYVSDSDNNRIQVFTSSGDYIRQFNTIVTRVFNILVDEFDGTKRVYVVGRRSCGSEQCAIHAYSTKGERVKSFGSIEEESMYVYTWSSGWGPKKTILLSHVHTPSIRVFSLEGDFVRTVDISTPNWIGLYDDEQSLSVKSVFDLLDSKTHTRIRSISRMNDKYVVQLSPSNFENDKKNLLSIYSTEGDLLYYSMKTTSVMDGGERLTLYEYLPEEDGSVQIERYAYSGQ